MSVYLLTGIPGQSKSSAASKIENFLKELGITVGIGKVEDELIDILSIGSKPSPNKDRLVSLIGERSQGEIKESWPQAYKNALKKASKGNPDISILIMSLEYYRSETYEFYSPIDTRAIQESGPRSILTLIDDIYEIYFRLSQPGAVFDIKELIARKYGSANRNSEDVRKLYQDALSVTIGSLLRVLVWREKEISCGENLAKSLGCEHSVLAVKHSVETGVRLLLGKTSVEYPAIGISYPVYVSHPISRPRRAHWAQGSWPSFPKDLERVVNALAEKGSGARIVPINPTAIDEFRILDDGTYLHPSLTSRWPIQEGELLYSRHKISNGTNDFISDEDFEHRGLSTIFDPPIDSSGRRVGLPMSDPEVSGMLRTLKDSIQLQMAGRDHLLVRQCPGFFLYRPLYQEFDFSSGVASEIHTFDRIRKYGRTIPGNRKRLIAFIHDRSDLSGICSSYGDGQFRDIVHQALASVTHMASRLVENSEIKTKRPAVPKAQTIAAALQMTGSMENIAKKIYNEMLPIPKEGSIGFEQPLPWEEVKEEFIKTLELERAKALSHAISGSVLFTYSEKDIQWKPKDWNGTGDTYVDLVDGMDEDSTRRLHAAGRARDFFANNS
jgi:hypothetical protein